MKIPLKCEHFSQARIVFFIDPAPYLTFRIILRKKEPAKHMTRVQKNETMRTMRFNQPL
jgi:hypothetical protein